MAVLDNPCVACLSMLQILNLETFTFPIVPDLVKLFGAVAIMNTAAVMNVAEEMLEQAIMVDMADMAPVLAWG